MSPGRCIVVFTWSLLVFLLFTQEKAYAEAVIRLSDTDTNGLLVSDVDFLLDPDKALTIADVVTSAGSSRFISTAPMSPNLGFQRGNTWLRMTFENQSKQKKWVFGLSNPSLEQVDFFTPTPDGHYHGLMSGLSVPLSKRPMHTRDHSFPLTLDTGEIKTVYLRVSSSTSLILAPWIMPRPYFRDWEKGIIALLAIIAGLLLAVALSNFIWLLTFRQAGYILFVLFDLSVGFFLAANFGLAHLYLWPEYPALAIASSPFFASMALLSGTLFARSYIDTKSLFPRLDRLFPPLAALSGFLVFWSLFHPPSANILISVISLLIMTASMVGCYLRLRMPHEKRRIFWALMLIGLLGGLLFVLMTFGLIPLSPITLTVGPLGFLLATLFLVFTVGHRYIFYQRHYSQLFNSANEAIFLLDSQLDEILDANKQATDMLGYSHTQIMQTGFPDLVDQEDPSWQRFYKRRLTNSFCDAQPIFHSFIFKTRKGASFLGEVTLRRLGKDSQSPHLVAVRDVTAMREAEDRLRQQQKLESIGTLASGVAHEINNPINIIMNYGQLILDTSEPNSNSYEYANEVVNECHRVANIVKNLLAFSKPEYEGSLSLIDMREVVTNTLTLMQRLLKKDQILIKIEWPADLPRVMGNVQQLKQVIMNLLTNSRDSLNSRYAKYDPNKQIRISAGLLDTQERPVLRLTIEDFGIGIPQQMQKRVFDPFFSTKTPNLGTGLGLSISHGIITDHGGELLVESVADRFTRFHIQLPIPIAHDQVSAFASVTADADMQPSPAHESA